jgi:hypothetical protein
MTLLQLLKKKEPLSLNQFREIVKRLGLNIEEVVGKEIWPFINPRGPYIGQRNHGFEKIKFNFSHGNKGSLDVNISGVYVEHPYHGGTNRSSFKYSGRVIEEQDYYVDSKYKEEIDEIIRRNREGQEGLRDLINWPVREHNIFL